MAICLGRGIVSSPWRGTRLPKFRSFFLVRIAVILVPFQGGKQKIASEARGTALLDVYSVFFFFVSVGIAKRTSLG